MSEAAHDHRKEYIRIFIILAVLTGVELGVALAHLPEWAMVGILVLLALVKAAFVAMYFMHLKYDHKVLTVIAGVPFLLLAIAIAIVSYEGTHDTISPEAAKVGPHPLLVKGAGHSEGEHSESGH